MSDFAIPPAFQQYVTIIDDKPVFSLPKGVNAEDVKSAYAAMNNGESTPIIMAAVDLTSAANKSIDLARLMFTLQLLFRETQAVEAQVVVNEMMANAHALISEAGLIREKAADAKEKADAAATKMMAAAIFTIVTGVVSLGVMGGMAAKMKTPDYTFISTVAGTGGKLGDGAASGISADATFDNNAAEEIRQLSASEQKEIESEISMAQADKQLAEKWEQHYEQLIQGMMQMAQQLLQEQTQTMRNIGRNI